MPTLPTIHLNGTSADDLSDGYKVAYLAVCDAVIAVAANGPNQRDYYPRGAEAWDQANNEHEARLVALKKVGDDLYAVLEGVCDGGHKATA